MKICPECGTPGLPEDMPIYDGQHRHGKCLAQKHGLEAIKALPLTEKTKIKLNDIGFEGMRELVKSIVHKNADPANSGGN